MSKEVQKKKVNNVIEVKDVDTSLLAMAPVLSSDHLRLRKLKIHQGTTQGRKGLIGELYLTPELAKLADSEEKVIMYPLTYKLSWFHSKKGPKDQKPTPTGVTPWKNAGQFQWEVIKPDGTSEKSYQTATFFVLLEEDLKRGDGVTPVQVVLSSTSFSAAALPLMNRYDEIKRFQVEPWLMKFALSSVTSPKGEWQVFKVDPVANKTGHEKAPQEYWSTIREWTKTMLNAQSAGDLETSAEDLAQDIDDVAAATRNPLRAKAVPEDQLEY